MGQGSGFKADASNIQFTSTLPTHHSVPGQYRITLKTEQIAEGKQLTLEYQLARRDAGNRQSKQDPETAVIASSLGDVEFSYFGSLRGKPDWKNGWSNLKSPPELVRIWIVWPTGEQTDLIIPIHTAVRGRVRSREVFGNDEDDS